MAFTKSIMKNGQLKSEEIYSDGKLISSNKYYDENYTELITLYNNFKGAK
jgi:hypothetical protein